MNMASQSEDTLVDVKPSKRKLVKLPKKRDVYENFMLKGILPEMSYFALVPLVYAAAKVTLGAIYYNDCSLEPRLWMYLLVSSGLLSLYLPVMSNLGQSIMGLKSYIRLATFVQLVGLCFGTYLLYNVHIGKKQAASIDQLHPVKVTCNDVIFKFTAACVAVEWTYIVGSFLARSFVTVAFHFVTTLLKNVFKLLFHMLFHKQDKGKTS